MSAKISTVIAGLLIASLTACATAAGPRQIDPGDTSRVSSWLRVSEIAPGAEIMLTARRSQPRSRYFIAADANTVTVLNLIDAALPARPARALREMASSHPEYFVATTESRTFQDGDLQVGRHGVIVAGRKVADLAQVVETVARGNVAEIEGPVVARGSVIGTLFGGWLGFAVGAVPALGGVEQSAAVALLAASVAVGGYLGFHWSSHQADGVIYRAP